MFWQNIQMILDVTYDLLARIIEIEVRALLSSHIERQNIIFPISLSFIMFIDM